MAPGSIELVRPDWPVSARVRACSTTRRGGVSGAPWHSLNLGGHVGDEMSAVVRNRERLARHLALPAEPLWLDQVHGSRVRSAGDHDACADACYADTPGRVCVVLTADCLPVLFSSRDGDEVAAAHAGWRGLLAGVLESTVASFEDPPQSLMAWLGTIAQCEICDQADFYRRKKRDAALVELDDEMLARHRVHVVLVTHDEDLARHARRIIRISDGRIIEDAPVADSKDAATLLAELPDRGQPQRRAPAWLWRPCGSHGPPPRRTSRRRCRRSRMRRVGPRRPGSTASRSTVPTGT